LLELAVEIEHVAERGEDVWLAREFFGCSTGEDQRVLEVPHVAQASDPHAVDRNALVSRQLRLP
jgi:hypothetical protein